MEPVLFLVHRIPYPPNKGDKVRSWNLLRQLADRYDVVLGTFVDDPADEVHGSVLESSCAELFARQLHPTAAKLASLSGLVRGEALSIPYYRDRAFKRWVSDVVARRGIRKAVVFSSPMAQYLDGLVLDRVIVDFVDVDSDKWRQFSRTSGFPMKFVYRREADRLAAFERDVAARADVSVFVTPAEARLFTDANPELAPRVLALANGVDTTYFDPSLQTPSPYASAEPAIVFTGAMDYLPNIDAVTWFARHVFPLVRARCPNAGFHVVGSRPAEGVRALTGMAGVFVHADVPDVRPFLRHAAVAVAPMRLGRGIQNKILEAMAMGKPTVVSRICTPSLSAVEGSEYLAADAPEQFASVVAALIERPDQALGERARARVLEDYAWSRNLGRLVDLLDGGGHGDEPGERTQPHSSRARPLEVAG